MSEIALQAIDQVTLAMDFDHGADQMQVVKRLRPGCRCMLGGPHASAVAKPTSRAPAYSVHEPRWRTISDCPAHASSWGVASGLTTVTGRQVSAP